MSEFDKWYEENFMLISADRTEAEDIYNLGKQSQQIKIDSLILEIAEMKSRLNDNYTSGQTSMYLTKQAKIDELQARVDKVVHILTYTNHASTPLCNELRDILKGNKDEN